jgi:hypothetical protein
MITKDGRAKDGEAINMDRIKDGVKRLSVPLLSVLCSDYT